MNKNIKIKNELDTIFLECRQCGQCCKNYRKILLMDDEVDFIKKMGGYVGVMVRMDDLRDKKMDQLVEEAKKKDDVYMIHPDEKGCVFLERVNGKSCCKIYNYRPKTCINFKCSLGENSLMDIILKDPLCLLSKK